MPYITSENTATYDRDGCVIVHDLFTPLEVEIMLDAADRGQRVADHTWSVADAAGQPANLAIWWELIDDVWSAASTNPRLTNAVRILMGEEIAFFHGKVILKRAHACGAWEWHQDYGYWYRDGFAYPRMISAWIALNKATRENGCLQVLKGSHKLGRIEHGTISGQVGADPERVPLLEKVFEHQYCEMEPGTVLFFHCNLLHASAPNTSDKDRLSFIVCYNALANPQLFDRKPAEVRACPIGPDDGILKFGSSDNSRVSRKPEPAAL